MGSNLLPNMPAEPTAATDPDSTAEHIKTAIDEDKLCLLLFAISVVGSVSCWSGVLVMPDWIYWGDKIHGMSFEITGPLFSLVAGYSYIKATGSRSRLQLLGAERLAGIASLCLWPVCTSSICVPSESVSTQSIEITPTLKSHTTIT